MKLFIQATWLMLLVLILNCPSHAKDVGRQQAVRGAERFIAENGYTDLPPMSDTSKLTFESIEWESDRKKILKGRRNTLQRKAYGFVHSSKKDDFGWTIVFRYKNSRNSKTGRAVTMDLDGKNKRVHHVDFILSECTKL